MKRVLYQGVYRGLGPALLASAALHGALAGLWVLWPGGDPRPVAEGAAVAGVINVVIAALPEAALPRSDPRPAPMPAAESEPTEIAPVPAAVIAPPAPPLAKPNAVEPRHPGSAERPARAGVRRNPSLEAGSNPLAATIQAVEPAAGAAPPGAAAEVDPALAATGSAETGPAAQTAAIGGALAPGLVAGAVKPPGYALGSAANPFPAYPVAARYDGAEGRVLLRVRVDAEGRVQGIEIVATSGHPILDRAATEAVRRWRFAPARAGGTTVPGEIDVPIQFRLRG
jgi:protein TonB